VPSQGREQVEPRNSDASSWGMKFLFAIQWSGTLDSSTSTADGPRRRGAGRFFIFVRHGPLQACACRRSRGFAWKGPSSLSTSGSPGACMLTFNASAAESIGRKREADQQRDPESAESHGRPKPLHEAPTMPPMKDRPARDRTSESGSCASHGRGRDLLRGVERGPCKRFSCFSSMKR